jgi:hypothetical protein
VTWLKLEFIEMECLDMMEVSRLGTFLPQFLPGIVGTVQLLTDALRDSSHGPEWSSDKSAAVAVHCLGCHHLGHATASPQVQCCVLSLSVAALDTHVGIVLQQVHSSRWPPLAFFSAELCPTQAHCSTFDQSFLPLSAPSATSGFCSRRGSSG